MLRRVLLKKSELDLSPWKDCDESLGGLLLELCNQVLRFAYITRADHMKVDATLAWL